MDESEFLDFGGEDEDEAEESVNVAEAPAKAAVEVAPKKDSETGGKKEDENMAKSAAGPAPAPAAESTAEAAKPVNGASTHAKSETTPAAEKRPGMQRVLSAEKLSSLSQALSKATEKPTPPKAVIVKGASASASKPATGVMASRTVMLTNVPDNLLLESKIASHLNRYGTVEKIECVKNESRAFVIFKDRPSANRAFVNRAPIFRDQSIHLLRIPDHTLEERADAISKAIESKNRIYKKAAAPAKTENQACASQTTTGGSTSGNTDEKPDSNETQPPGGGDSNNDSSQGGGSLYSDINLTSRPTKKVARKGIATEEKDKQPRAGMGKRTWMRAGLANMHDKEVVKAKQKVKMAQAKVETAKRDVDDLLEQLKKQKEQFLLIGKGGASIGKNLRAELHSNINLLMAQLKSAQGSMAAAKAGSAAAKKLLDQAIENSRAPGDEASAQAVSSTNATSKVVSGESKDDSAAVEKASQQDT